MARVYRGRELVSRQIDDKSKQKGYVYFMQAPSEERLIKIGWSGVHPDARLKRIRATSPSRIVPLAMIKGGMAIENAWHIRFIEHWSHGEWFRPAPELVERIELEGEAWPDPVTARRRPTTDRVPVLKPVEVEPKVESAESPVLQKAKRARRRKPIQLTGDDWRMLETRGVNVVALRRYHESFASP